ncbi:MAG TPA: precorrin-2 C(20)-methyltransferase [Acidisoma sp.]|uniref:precorrin-2 C(20)-methyltransferase n=1 Tax=Acidisoma sp. TaxID=1872115 RepID=UPI002C855CE2|nr:precorrin-2 C(20)-methyltransferase [Acidisoma sp.]HTH99747.1 precorrin-2 C(20)-methyltransferase [Acidisoma sp.]
MTSTKAGRLYTIGMGPGDPELLTLKAARILGAVPAIAYFAKVGQRGHARTLADGHLRPETVELRFDYPVTVELSHNDERYVEAMAGCYDAAAEAIAARLSAGQDVALLCEGDPFFYGSSMYLFDRLRERFAQEVVPGIPGMVGCWAAAQLPMTHGDDVLAVLPGTMEEAALEAALQGAQAAVIMKLGRNLPKVRRVLERLGRQGRTVYVERGTMAAARIVPLAELGEAPAPYFSMLLIPGRQERR